MGAPFKELDDKAIAKAHLIPEEVALYIGHHLRNDLSGILYIAQKLEYLAAKEDSVELLNFSERLNERVRSMAKDLADIGI